MLSGGWFALSGAAAVGRLGVERVVVVKRVRGVGDGAGKLDAGRGIGRLGEVSGA